MKYYNEVVKRIIEFRDDRNWKQFHSIKNLIPALNIEVSELQELFLWKTEKEIEDVEKEKIEDELSDVFIYLTYISVHFNINLLESVERKIIKNGEKYPVEKSYGSIKKYTELQKD